MLIEAQHQLQLEMHIVRDKNHIAMIADELWDICIDAFPLKRRRSTSIFDSDPEMIFRDALMEKYNYVVIGVLEQRICCFFLVEKEFDNDLLHLRFVSTRTIFHRRGYMKQLLQFFLKSTNLPVQLDVYRDNPAMSLYSSLGFRVVSVDNSIGMGDEHFYQEGDWSPLVQMLRI
jgi:ribosomal protein S18 acetylase RimI-like enzyme